MELSKYQKALRAMTNRNSNLDRVIYDPSIVELDTMPVENPPMDNVMPSFEGLEDPKVLEDYQQIELAEGGVVEREGFSEGDQPFDGRIGNNPVKATEQRAKNLRELQNKKYQKGYGTAQQLLEKLKQTDIKAPNDIINVSKFAQVFGIKSKRNPYDKNSRFNIYKIDQLDDPSFVESIEKKQVRVGRSTPNAREKYPPKGAERKLAQSKERYKKQKEHGGRQSSKKKYDPFMGTKEINKSHMNDLYSQYITGQNLGYLPSTINESLGSPGGIDNKMKALYQKRKRLLKQKPENLKKQLEDINIKGARLSGQSQGFKTFTIMDPTSKKEYEFGGKRFQIDPTNQFPDMTESEIVDFIQKADPDNFDDQLKIKLFEDNRKSVFNTVKKQKKTLIKDFNKSLTQMEGKVGCSNMVDGGRVNFSGGSSCVAKGIEKIKSGNLTTKEKNILKDFTKNKAFRAAAAGRGAFLIETLGPLGVGGEALLSVADAYGETRAKGTPFKESFADQIFSYLAPQNSIYYKDGVKQTSEDLLNTEIVKQRPGAEKYLYAKKKLEQWQNLKNEYADSNPAISYDDAGIETTDMRGREKIEKKIIQFIKEVGGREGIDELEKMVKPDSPFYNEYESAREVVIGTRGLDIKDTTGMSEEQRNRQRYADIGRNPDGSINPVYKQNIPVEEERFFDANAQEAFKQAAKEKYPNIKDNEIQAVIDKQNLPYFSQFIDPETGEFDERLKPQLATGGRVKLSLGGKGINWVARRIQDINKLIKSKKFGPEDFFDEIQLLEKAEELNLTQEQINQILKQQQQQRIENYRKLPIQGEPAAKSRLPYDPNAKPSTGKKLKIKPRKEKNLNTQDLDYESSIDDIMSNYATGGRVGLDKGGKPKNPSRRTFIKGAGALGLAIAAFGTGALKLAKTLKTKTALKVLSEPAVGQPEWFAPLVDKILLKGISLEKDGKKLNKYVLEEDGKTITLETSPITNRGNFDYIVPSSSKNPIKINVKGGGAYDDPFDIQYYQTIDKTTGKTKASLEVLESRPYRFGPDPDEVELSEEIFIGSDLLELPKGGSGILSDMEGLEKIATGKIKNTKLANTRMKVRDELNQPDNYRSRYNPGEEDRMTRSTGPDGGEYYENLDGEDYYSVKMEKIRNSEKNDLDPDIDYDLDIDYD